MKRTFALIFLLVFALSAAAQRPADSAQLQLALKKLTVAGSALYIAAHPDDENTALLAYWSNDRLYRTGYLALTRGDGGQNLIGDEKGELLGVIRTQELLAARRIDGAEQMFSRALDFGFSKGPDETLAIWGHDRILADVVWAIRKFQPDVIVTRFPTTGEGGHGHHTASAILAVEAFKLAGDPTKFPEQLKYVAPWQPKRIFWNKFSSSFQPFDPNDPKIAKSLRIDLGAFNPLLGRAYTEMAAESRSQHKSQGFGSAERRGTTINYFDQLDGVPAANDLFDGVDVSWSRYPGGDAVGKILQQASDTFDPKAPEKSIPLLLDAAALLDRLGARPEWSPKVNPWIEVKRNELMRAIAGCAGLAIDVSAADSAVVAGHELKVTVSVINRSAYPFTLQTVGSRYATPSLAVGKRLENNVPLKTDLTIKAPADEPVSQPYWLRKPPLKGSFVVDDQELIGRPENPPAIPIIVTLVDDRMHTIFYTVPAIYRWTDPVRGEQTRNVDVVPDVVTNIANKVYVFPDAKPKQVVLRAKSFSGAGQSTVSLKVPAGWSVSPESVPVTFKEKGDEVRATFTVTPPEGESIGVAQASAMSLVDIEYPHIPAQRVFGEGTAKLIRETVKKRGTRIGYIMGSGDEVPEGLRQIGYEVNMLTDDDLEKGNFGGYDAIVAGVRAYNTRKRLKLDTPKLLDWVKNGGTYVVQYNTSGGLIADAPGPYPFKITNERVTVEEAPVTFLKPEHPLLTTPNKITQKDFEGWVQERGLNFTKDWDPKYETVISSHDPGEEDKPGGELYAKYGNGVFVYTCYDWFRELPAGVPGAYRLIANIVSAK
ncbi:MAG TPA: PIG-L family deacetylase [Thermoanaerobaculia bacterium]|nr:PIG-L family deacetylase [Thermoanaerobaculia bacterium]